MPTPVIAWDENAAAASAALGVRTVTTLSGSVIPKEKELKARFQIGSIKGECNFGPSTAAFHITNVPPAKLEMATPPVNVSEAIQVRILRRR